MNETAAIRLYQAIKNISEKPQKDNLIFGTVKAVNPLKIDIGNNVILNEDFLFLGQMCRPHKVTIPHSHIIDTHFTQKSKAIGDHIAGTMPASIPIQEAQLDTAAETNMISYTQLQDPTGEATDGQEISKTVSEKTLGRGKVEKQLVVGGQATVTNDQPKITDNGHQHIIPRQNTKDVHYPRSEYENGVTICIEPALKVGDIVLMFAFNNFQMYYVAERIESPK